MKILIPTDFSSLSKVAIEYAIQLGIKFKAELILITVVNIEGPARGSLKAKDLEAILLNDARNDCISLVEEIKSKHKFISKISFEVIAGYPVEKVVCNFAKKNEIDFIIMGTKGATGLKRIFLGSNTASVFNKSTHPVIAVPEFAKFKDIADIVYATDIMNLHQELEKVVSFARDFNARVHILHVTSPREEMAIDAKGIVEELINKLKYGHISFAVSHADDPAEGIDEYVIKNKIDMLAMFTHELTFFEKLRGKGITRQVAFLNNVPLLAFKK